MFITFEGPDGSGKTTQVEKTYNYLWGQKGIKCVKTREPGGTILGQTIRKLLVVSGGEKIDPFAELLLFMADRAHHINTFILPQINLGKVVLCDRFVDSTVAYQGDGRGIGSGRVLDLHKMVFSDFMPDLTFLLDIDPKVGLSRTSIRFISSQEADESRFEEEELAFHEKVRNNFLKIAKSNPERFCVINAELSSWFVWQQIKKRLNQFFESS